MKLLLLLIFISCSKKEDVTLSYHPFSLKKGTVLSCPEGKGPKLQLLKDVTGEDLFSASAFKSLTAGYIPTSGSRIPCNYRKYKTINQVVFTCYHTTEGWSPSQCN